MNIVRALQFTAVCTAVMIAATLRGDRSGVVSHTKHSPLKLSFGKR